MTGSLFQMSPAGSCKYYHAEKTLFTEQDLLGTSQGLHNLLRGSASRLQHSADRHSQHAHCVIWRQGETASNDRRLLEFLSNHVASIHQACWALFWHSVGSLKRTLVQGGQDTARQFSQMLAKGSGVTIEPQRMQMVQIRQAGKEKES